MEDVRGNGAEAIRAEAESYPNTEAAGVVIPADRG